MPGSHEPPIGPLAQIVRDTLDAVVSPGVRDAILLDAIRRGRLAGLPTERPALAAFVMGPLRTVAEAAVGRALAGTIIEEVLRGLARAPASLVPAPERSPAAFTPLETHRAPKWRKSSIPSFPTGPASTTRPQAASRDTEPASMDAARASGRALSPLILVATAETLLFETLAEWFDHRALVERVASTEAIVTRIVEENARRILVILDGKRPSIEPRTLVDLLDPAPDVRVVLCRAAPALEDAVVTALPAGAEWFVYREPATLDHVAAECLRLVS